MVQRNRLFFFWCSVKSQSCVRVCVSISDIKKKHPVKKDVCFCLLNTSIVSLVFFLQCEKIYWSVLELHVKLFCSRPTCNWALIESMLCLFFQGCQALLLKTFFCTHRLVAVKPDLVSALSYNNVVNTFGIRVLSGPFVLLWVYFLRVGQAHCIWGNLMESKERMLLAH